MQATIEATRVAVVMALTRAEAGTKPRSKSISMGLKLGRPTLKQHTFNGSATGKYAELRNFRLEINNIFQTYNINNAGRVHIIKKPGEIGKAYTL